MAISSSGLGSNLDVNSIVTQLMQLERRPQTLIDRKEVGYQAKLSAFGTLKGALSGLQTAITGLTNPAKFATPRSSFADATIASATANSVATAGSHSIEVQNLAQAQRLNSKAFTNVTDVVGSGTLTLQFGTYDSGSNTFTANGTKAARTITIDVANNTLSGVRDAINAATAGVTASIVNDGSGYRLVLASNDSGAANSIRLTVADANDASNVDDAGLSQLAFDPAAAGVGTGKNLAVGQTALNATAIVNGLTVSKASNTFSDVIQGVSLTLLKANAGTPTTLTIAKDVTGIRSSIEAFVKAYNDTSSTLNQASSVVPGQIGALAGDATVRTVQARLRAIMAGSLPFAPGGLTNLSDIGITFQKDGAIAFNSAKLQTALNDPSKDVATLFAAVGKSTDGLITVNATGSVIKPGSHAVNITQLATQAKASGSAVLANPVTISSGVNDVLQVNVDGVDGSITLAAGDYTPVALAAELQSRINGLSGISGSGSSVTIALTGGALNVTSNRYGSNSSLQIQGGTALSTLFGTVDASLASGRNVAGTIGGEAATGSGQTLTGSGEVAELQIEVLGGTTGDRGVVNYTEGLAHQFNAYLAQMLNVDGLLSKRTEGLQDSVKGLDAQRIALSRRLEQVEKRYRTQYTALDTLISSMTRTSNFLQQQLANLPKIGQ